MIFIFNYILSAGARAEDVEDVEDVVIVAPTEAEALQRSAAAVEVVDLAQDRERAADLGEVLARSHGVSVRRSGGLGSDARFSLNGLVDDQVRFFLDGVPLELAGFPFGVANVPVDLLDRVEVYRGVVPIRFGADALGGAVNLVSSADEDGTSGSVSYQAGSFGVHRLAAGVQHHDERTGVTARGDAWLDRADNDYLVGVQVPSQQEDTLGQLVPATVRRFADRYAAQGGALELGLREAPWIDRLTVRGFVGGMGKDIQSNPTMEVPYGDVRAAEETLGGSARAAHAWDAGASVDVVAGHTRTRSDFTDVGTCLYDWFGQCVRERQAPGEINEGIPEDLSLFEEATFARSELGQRLGAHQTVRASLAPTLVRRNGEDRIRTDPDEAAPIEAVRSLATFVAGAEHDLSVSRDRLHQVAFAKVYAQGARSEDPVIGGVVAELDRSVLRGGFGDALRWALSPRVLAKVSYEYATRLPRADEVFGDAMLTNENLELRPESSHNVNAELRLDDVALPNGVWRTTFVGFLREAKDLIVLLPAYDQRFRHENVFAARSAGVEAAVGWTSDRDRVALDANGTYVDLRNLADSGPFSPFVGDRIPNRPYLFANASARVQADDALVAGDRLVLSWDTRYVHDFFQSWESAGTAESKRTIPAQLTHAAALTLAVRADDRSFAFTNELLNLTNATTYDLWGAQRPGRAVAFKVTAQL